MPKVPGWKRFELWYEPKDRERWDEDARQLGFPRGFSSRYLRYILNGRVEGRLILLDPGTMKMFEMMGAVFGSTVGNILARLEHFYLEGDVCEQCQYRRKAKERP